MGWGLQTFSLGARPGPRGPDVRRRVLTVRSLTTCELNPSSGVRVLCLLNVSERPTIPRIHMEEGVPTRTFPYRIKGLTGEGFPRDTGALWIIITVVLTLVSRSLVSTEGVSGTRLAHSPQWRERECTVLCRRFRSLNH